MSSGFTVLASGSSGNASLLEVHGFGVLVDAGLGPRQLSGRLATAGKSWQNVHAVLLTHTHSDHWKATTLAQLAVRRIPLYCHDEHLTSLSAECPAVERLHRARLVRTYEAEQRFSLGPGLHCLPLSLRHDSGATFGFRFDAGGDLCDAHWSLVYLADLGCWDASLAQAAADIDVLALEFNHDVWMQQSSGRHPQLIARILGDEGHLSNDQAADFLRQVASNSAPSRLGHVRLGHVVQLHLSRQCNRPALAAEAARAAIAELDLAIELLTACQDAAGPTIPLGIAPSCRAASG